MATVKAIQYVTHGAFILGMSPGPDNAYRLPRG
jgi:hypothetical protein